MIGLDCFDVQVAFKDDSIVNVTGKVEDCGIEFYFADEDGEPGAKVSTVQLAEMVIFFEMMSHSMKKVVFEEIDGSIDSLISRLLDNTGNKIDFGNMRKLLERVKKDIDTNGFGCDLGNIKSILDQLRKDFGTNENNRG